MKPLLRLDRRQEGFTLIELLVVMAILAVLATMVVPNVLGSRERSRNTDVQAGVRKIQSGLELYAIDNNGGYPIVFDLKDNLENSYVAEWPANPWTESDMVLNILCTDHVSAEGTSVGDAAKCVRGGFIYIPEATGGSSIITQYTLYGFGVNTAGDTITVIKVGVK
ncbi:MAG: type II secretion system protein [Firmicutes bacterium]|nr:type II secretion system protein [Bacillota bacterium]